MSPEKMIEATGEQPSEGAYPDSSPIDAVLTATQLGGEDVVESSSDGQSTGSESEAGEDEIDTKSNKSRDGGDDTTGGDGSPKDPDASSSVALTYGVLH